MLLKYRLKALLQSSPYLYHFAKALYHGVTIFKNEYKKPIVTVKQIYRVKKRWKLQQSFYSRVPPNKRPKIQREPWINDVALVTIDIIVPVYNRGDLALILVRELRKQIDRMPSNYIFRLIVSDDASDQSTVDLLQNYSKILNYEFLRNERNVGFIGNVNKVWHLTQGQFIILLNSDVEVHNDFLSRALRPFGCDKSVALSTSPTFNMIASHVPSGENIHNVNEYLRSISNGLSNFVDACTAVGYALTIRRSSILDDYLFDPKFGQGYGEDSDLHYRLVERGWRSVWNLDSIVSHLGGASFDNKLGVDSERMQGKNLFFSRWGSRYFSEIKLYEQALNEAFECMFGLLKPSTEIRNWIVLPTVSKTIGGIMVGEELALEIISREPQSRIVTLDDTANTVVKSAAKVGNLTEMLNSQVPSVIYLVGSQSLSLLASRAIKYPGHSFIYFAQGPDWLIDPSTLEIHFKCFPELTSITSVSNYMDREVLQFLSDVKINRYTPSLNHAFFAGLESTTSDIDFVFIHRNEHGKSGWLSIALANLLGEKYNVTVVSPSIPFGLSRLVNLEISPTRGSLLKLFARSAVYVDTSLFEGFGLTSREAAILGAHTVFLQSGDGRSELENFPQHFTPFAFTASVFEIARLAEGKLKSQVCIGCKFCTQ